MEDLKHDSGTVDLAIIGGGPAGTAAALEARRHGLSVAIWERDRFPREKVCGEFISSEALPLLQNEIPGTVARGTGIHYAEFVLEHGATRTFRLPHPALGLSRHLLDAALWKAAEAAWVDACEGESVRRVRKLVPGRKQRTKWEIESAGGSVRWAKDLIVACGRWWTVEGLTSPVRWNSIATPGDWVGVKAHFAGVPPSNNVELYFFRGGYCGLAPVEDSACNVCCLMHRERVRKCGPKGLEDFAGWLSQISQLPALESRLRDATQVSPVETTAPVSLARRQAVQSGALMVGDASGFLDPFTGEGISMALHSGRLAARAIVKSLREGCGDECAAEIYGQGLARAVQRSYKIAAMTRSLMQGPEWLRRLVTTPLPWIGKKLVRETRWRGDGNVNRG
jgi:flavin-dependent dehydrogenase